MAVSETSPDKAGAKPKGMKAWVKKNKLLAGGIGAGGIVLLLASKGKKSSKSEAAEELKNATELARQTEQERQIAASNGSPSSTGGGSGGGGTEGSAGAPVTSQPTSADLAQAVAEGNVGLISAIQANNASIEGLEAKSTAAPGGESESSVVKGQYEKAEKEKASLQAKLKAAGKKKAASKGKKPKPKKSSKTTAATKHTGTTVDGRHFPGAKGHTVTKTHVGTDGKSHKTVKVDHGGTTTTHTSHDNGKSWTDHPAGSSPPSRTKRAQSHPANKPIPRLQSRRTLEKKLAAKKPVKRKRYVA